MKRITILTLFVGLGMLSLACSTPAGNDEQTLIQLEQDWSEALVKADQPAFDRIMAVDYIFIDPDGQVVTKAQGDAEFKAGVTKFDAFVSDDMKVRVFGDTAIVTGRATMTGTSKGKDISGQDRWTDVFVRRDGRWQAVSSHASHVKPTEDAWEVGTWKLNLAQSKFDPGPPPQSETRTWRDGGGGVLIYTGEGVDAQRRPFLYSLTFKIDGQEFPVTYSSAVTYWQRGKRTDATTVEFSQILNGKPIGIMTRTLSQDRKSLAYRGPSVNVQGQVTNNVMVFDKQ